MSLPQSNIDWARYMEGLQGKTNLDLTNTTDKLAVRFISKLMPDYSAGIDLAAYNSASNQFKAPTAGCIFCYCDTYNLGKFFINGQDHRVGNAGNDTVSSDTMSVFVDKGDSIYITYQLTTVNTGTNNPPNAFYPLKGAN